MNSAAGHARRFLSIVLHDFAAFGLIPSMFMRSTRFVQNAPRSVPTGRRDPIEDRHHEDRPIVPRFRLVGASPDVRENGTGWTLKVQRV